LKGKGRKESVARSKERGWRRRNEKQKEGGGKEGRETISNSQWLKRYWLAKVYYYWCKHIHTGVVRGSLVYQLPFLPPLAAKQASYSPSAHPVIPSTVSSMGSTWILLPYFTSGKAVTLQHTGTSNKLQLKICNSSDIIVYLSFSLVVFFFFPKIPA